MSLLSIILTAVGLAMDAFAVSITLGMSVLEEKKRLIALKAGLFFGIFQGLMPLFGYILGIRFTEYIESIDHWIAFILLLIIGGKMIIDSIKGEDEEDIDIHTNRKFLILSVATSIDALAIGVSFAFLKINIIYSASIIALVTFVLSFAAVYLGKLLGNYIKNKAGIFGGIILILIGTKILLEHLKIF